MRSKILTQAVINIHVDNKQWWGEMSAVEVGALMKAGLEVKRSPGIGLVYTQRDLESAPTKIPVFFPPTTKFYNLINVYFKPKKKRAR